MYHRAPIAVAAAVLACGAAASALEPTPAERAAAAESHLVRLIQGTPAGAFLRAAPPIVGPGGAAPAGGGGARADGPDVIVGDLHQLNSYGSVGGVSAFSVGTVSCNVGNQNLSWIELTNEHPVIGQNMYRYMVVDGAGRFEQIGQSWLKHGFFALSQDLCFPDCQATDGSSLGVHCSDPYSANLNGRQDRLGPRSEVNPSTGFFLFPFGGEPVDELTDRRMQVHNSDLDPAQNPGAVYFVEGQYIAADDAAAGNDNNNASYRRVAVTATSGQYTLSFVDKHGTHREQSAIYAWQEMDPSVSVVHIDVPDDGAAFDGRFSVGSRVTNLGGGMWRYEYAVQNLNSDAAGGSFTVPVADCVTVTNIGFHDVDSHSGEPYSLEDWNVTVGSSGITWSTDTFTEDPNANALRWGTMYNFRFDANVPPAPGHISIGLFKPWNPGSVAGSAAVPDFSSCPCRADFNGDGDLTAADFSAFRGAFLAGDDQADFNDDGDLTPGDFSAFRNAFLAGCP